MGSDTPGVDDKHGAVCLGSDWQDFMVYYAVKAYDENNMIGYYFDEGRYRCANALHGHDGKYPILEVREFHKRLAVEFAKRGRSYLLWIHSSGNIEMPALSFANMIWNGEQYSTTATVKGYNDLISLDAFRAEFLGQPFGIPIQWLSYSRIMAPPERKAPTPEEIEARKLFDETLELALLHGVADLIANSVPQNNGAYYQKQVLDVQERFGVSEKDAHFLPYWKNTPYVQITPADENLVGSIWQRPGKILLIVGNSTPKDQEATVKLDLKTLGLGDQPGAADTRTGENLEITAGMLGLRISSKNWRMIIVEKRK